VNWPVCKSLTKVQGFLRTVGTIYIFIKNYATIACLLVHLTCKNVEFTFGKEELVAMEKLKKCKKAKLQAGIKPTVLCSVIDKKNLIEFLLDLLYYIYNYYCGYAPYLPRSSCYSSADFFVTCYDYDMTIL